jgi:hypothetical protein
LFAPFCWFSKSLQSTVGVISINSVSCYVLKAYKARGVATPYTKPYGINHTIYIIKEHKKTLKTHIHLIQQRLNSKEDDTTAAKALPENNERRNYIARSYDLSTKAA